MALQTNHPGTATGTETPSPGTAGFTQAPASKINVITESRRFDMFSLSQAHTDYLENIRKILHDRVNYAGGSVPFQIRRVALETPSNAQAFVGTDTNGKKAASIIIFADAIVPYSHNFSPVSMRIESAAM